MCDEINSCLSELNDKIRGLYAQAHELIKGDAHLYNLKPIMFEINQVFSEMECAVLQESDAVTFVDSLGSMQAQQLVKSEFDAKVTEWLESKDVAQREINQILGSSRTLRSKGMLLNLLNLLIVNINLSVVLQRRHVLANLLERAPLVEHPLV